MGKYCDKVDACQSGQDFTFEVESCHLRSEDAHEGKPVSVYPDVSRISKSPWDSLPLRSDCDAIAADVGDWVSCLRIGTRHDSATPFPRAG
jgi:hypothetical protein